MAIPTKAEARRTFGPYHPLIWRIIHEAFAEWRKVQQLRADNGLAPLLYDRTKSNDIFDAIARRGILGFGAEERVNLIIESQTFKIVIGGIAARIKKGGDDKLGSSIPTLAALSFIEADGELLLPGVDASKGKVEIIWLPNQIWTQVDQILVIARDGDKLIWEYEIEDPGASGGGEIVPFPAAPTPPPEMDDEGLVKPKAKPRAPSKKQ